jgi:FkbM family methyltransferase
MKVIKKEYGEFYIPDNMNLDSLYDEFIQNDIFIQFDNIHHVIVFGSNYGHVEMLICNSNTAVSIYSFEPRDTCFCLLKKNLDHNKIENVLALNNALGHVNGDVAIPRDLIEKGVELNTNEIIELGNGQLVGFNNQFNFVTIDSLNLIACDMLFIDFPGFEYMALAGSINTIKKFKPIICVKCSNNMSVNSYFGINGKINDFLVDLNYNTETVHKFIISRPCVLEDCFEDSIDD